MRSAKAVDPVADPVDLAAHHKQSKLLIYLLTGSGHLQHFWSPTRRRSEYLKVTSFPTVNPLVEGGSIRLELFGQFGCQTYGISPDRSPFCPAHFLKHLQATGRITGEIATQCKVEQIVGAAGPRLPIDPLQKITWSANAPQPTEAFIGYGPDDTLDVKVRQINTLAIQEAIPVVQNKEP
jgi:hypothetical protein